MSNLQDPRVLLALERTLLAWNRSSLALIIFGFVIEKATLLGQVLDPIKYADRIIYSQWLGVAVIVFGLCISFWSIVQYRIALRSLTQEEMIEGYNTYLPIVVALFSILTGFLLMISFLL